MKMTRLGRTGLEVSRICLGMMTYGSPLWREWVLDESKARPLVAAAVEAGVNFFDTADMYSNGQSEILTGKFLKEMTRRDEVVVATKVYFPVFDDISTEGQRARAEDKRPNARGLSRKHIFAAIDASLTRLGMDYVDLYQIHRWDPDTPIEETMEALHDVVKAGKARYIGASSMWAWQFARAQEVARTRGLTPFVSMQNHYNLLYREEEREMIPLCRFEGVGLIPWSPLARGFLAGNRRPGDATQGMTTRARTDEFAQQLYYREGDFEVVDALSRLASERGESNATFAYAWLLAKRVTAPIVGCSKPEHLKAALRAPEITLQAAELEALEAPYRPHPVLGHS